MTEKKIIATFPLVGAGSATKNALPSFRPLGFVGESCLEATRHFETALGSAVESEATDEMYETEDRQEFLNEGGDNDAA